MRRYPRVSVTPRVFATRLNRQRRALDERIEECWTAVRMFVANRDPHGCYDLLIELQCLNARRAELDVAWKNCR